MALYLFRFLLLLETMATLPMYDMLLFHSFSDFFIIIPSQYFADAPLGIALLAVYALLAQVMLVNLLIGLYLYSVFYFINSSQQ